MKKLLISIIIGIVLGISTMPVASPHQSPSALHKVNEKFEIVLKDKDGNTKTYQVCAENKEQAIYGAFRAWSHEGQVVDSITYLGACSN